MKRVVLFLSFLSMCFLLYGQNLESTLKSYQFDGKFYNSNLSFPFRGNAIKSFQIWEDENGQATIQSVSQQTAWKTATAINPQKEKVYWLKTRMQGSTIFNGTQLLHVTPELGNDLYSFDHIDIYVPDGKGGFDHQKTGDHIPLRNRSYSLWANLIQFELTVNDTFDIYVRLGGMDRYFPTEKFGLWHIDSASVFPRQLEEASKKILYYGIMSIQFMFFLCLFFIEKERIHLTYSGLILGLFLSFAFIFSNYHTYVPFPLLKDYHFFIFMLGLFITKWSSLKFVETYFNYPIKEGYSKRMIKYTIVFYAVLDLFTFIKISMGSFTANRSLFVAVMACASLVFVPFFYLAIKARHVHHALRKLFYIAFIPLALTLLLIASWDFIFPFLENFLKEEYIFYRIYLRNLSMIMIVFMLSVLALSIGYRKILLKQEKDKALQQNLINQQTILENKLQTEQLQEINKMKTRFFTNITHELRTPLTIIMGINNELAERNQELDIDEPTKQQMEQSHHLIQRNSNNLLHLINQLLDFSKADSGMLTLDMQQADIIPYLNYLTESFISKAQEKNIRLVFYPEINKLVMDFDEIKIQHLVYNLLSNALKFTERDGKVVLHAQQVSHDEKSHLSIKVKDSGLGIPKEELEAIFDRFYQIAPSNTRKGEGTGIGLALTKELVELMGGSIEAESVLGEGTVISILLPIHNQAAYSESSWSEKPTPIAAPIEPETIIDFEDSELEDAPLLLIVEDNQDITLYIRQFLQDQYQIQTALNGKEGIELAFKTIPDIIISDVMMPQKDGFELTKTLKSDPRTSHIPIVLLTAKATETGKMEGLKKGADAYLMKPFNKTELMIRLEQLLALRKALQERYLGAQQEPSSTINKVPEEELSLDEQFLNKLQNYLDKHIADPEINIEKLCKAVNLGQSQLYRKLKALTNNTPNSYVRTLRLHKAMEMLKSTKLNISEIAYATGFKDPNYFSRAFHKQFGNSPREFRK